MASRSSKVRNNWFEFTPFRRTIKCQCPKFFDIKYLLPPKWELNFLSAAANNKDHIFMNMIIRMSSGTQMWCLRHPNFLTRGILTLLYSVEVASYSISGAKTFLTRREALFGSNYAALGRLIVGEYAATADIIKMPQKRGNFLGPARLKGKRLPHGFLLSLSDEGAGGDGLHEKLAKFFWDSIIVPSQASFPTDTALQKIVDDFAQEIKGFGASPTKDQIKAPVERMMIRYMMRTLFQIEVTEAQVDTVQVLFYTGGLTTNYIARLVSPFALPSFLLGGMRSTMAKVVSWVENSNALADYAPGDVNANFSKGEWAELVTAVVGIAALGGSGDLVIRMLSEYPAGQPKTDLDDDRAVMNVVLESARREAPVNNINVVLAQARTFKIQGKDIELPPGTVVAACIGLASLDADEFPDPEAFNPNRDNLISALLNYNSVGYQETGAIGRRACPGRNIATTMGMSVFRAWQRALAEG